MYIINTIPHGKCFIRYLRTRCFCIRNLTRSLRSLVRFLIRHNLCVNTVRQHFPWSILYVHLESKIYIDYIKYLGVLIDQNLSWKYHIDSIIATKISKNVELIAKLRHSVPRPILLNIYKSLIHLYLTYGLAAWVTWNHNIIFD